MSSCLIIKNDGMGDMVMSIGIINHIASQHKSTDILCNKISKEVVDSFINIDDVFYVSRDLHFQLPSFARRSLFNCFKDTIKAIIWHPDKNDRLVRKKLLDNEYDVVIVIRRYIRQSTFYFMSAVKAKRKICFWQYPTNITIEHGLKYSDGWEYLKGDAKILHEFEYYQEVLRPLYGEVRELKRLSVGNKNTSENRKVISVVLGNVKKGMNVANWKAYLFKLVSKGMRIRIFGGADTREAMYEFASNSEFVSLYAGELSLIEGVKEACKSDVVLGSDTGMMHLCAMYDVKKMIILCSSETPYRFFPWPKNINQYVIYNMLSCSDCGYCTKTKRSCIVNMPIKKLFSLFDELIFEVKYEPGVFNLSDEDDYVVARRWN